LTQSITGVEKNCGKHILKRIKLRITPGTHYQCQNDDGKITTKSEKSQNIANKKCSDKETNMNYMATLYCNADANRK